METVTNIEFIDALVDRCGNDVHRAALKDIRKELEEAQKQSAPPTNKSSLQISDCRKCKARWKGCEYRCGSPTCIRDFVPHLDNEPEINKH